MPGLVGNKTRCNHSQPRPGAPCRLLRLSGPLSAPPQLHWRKWPPRGMVSEPNCLPARPLAADAVVGACVRARVARASESWLRSHA
eukprot:6208744-Pleurochrysis_carterae.AAC.2